MNFNYSKSPGHGIDEGTGNRAEANLEGASRSASSQPTRKEISMSTMHCSLLSLGCVFGFAPPNQQVGLSALRAFKIAQRRLRPEVRAKLLSVSSSRTDSSLVPDAWRFVFLDPATSGNCRVVTVAAKTSSEHPDTVEAFSAAKNESATGVHAIAQNKWGVDSDQALANVRGSAKLKGITSAEYRLSQPRSGQEPLWFISFYAVNVEPVARFQLGAKSGAIKILSKD
jgi:hypothetical protein